MIKKLSALALAAAVSTFGISSVASAQDDAIAQRKAVFKAMGAATAPAGAALQGKAPFDLAKVQAALDNYQKSGAQLPGLFPDNSKTGGETEALPAIWENKADFNGRFAKLAADAKAAKAAITDEASFKAEFPKVLASCGGCHKAYRVVKAPPAAAPK